MGETHGEPFDHQGFLPGTIYRPSTGAGAPHTEPVGLIELKCQRLEVWEAEAAGICGTEY